MEQLRFMTYNVHSCRGADRRLLPERIAEVVASASPDVVALQELDVGQSRSHGMDQAALLAERLRMQCHFVAARACHGGHYGNAILTRHSSHLVRAAALPQLHVGCEPRAAQWVRLETPVGALDVLNVHFGLLRRERKLQTETLLSTEWLRNPELASKLVLCGDFNAGPRSRVYRRITAQLRDAQEPHPRATFPALLPIFRIDHIFVSSDVSVQRTWVLTSRLARLASDHRPLVAEIRLTGET